MKTKILLLTNTTKNQHTAHLLKCKLFANITICINAVGRENIKLIMSESDFVTAFNAGSVLLDDKILLIVNIEDDEKEN